MKPRPDMKLLAVVAVALGSFAPSAFAYLDPSTGSMILSAIIGVFATAGLVIKNYWYKLKGFFRGAKSENSDNAEAAAADNAARESTD